MKQITGQLISVSLTDIADIDRAKSNIVYPARTIYVQVSAAPKYTDEIWHILKRPGELPGKYAVVVPKIPIIPSYLVLALTAATAEWQSRYIGDAINISIELFKELKVVYHPDIEIQAKILESVSIVDRAIEIEAEQVRLNKEAKEFFLQNMFPEAKKNEK